MDNSDEVYIIQKEGYVGNSLLWWAKGDRGYTTNIMEAQEFNDEESLEIVNRPSTNKIRHKQSDILQVAEFHVNSESEAFNDYKNTNNA